MSDYSETGAWPVEDAAVEDPPSVDDVAEAQLRDFPEQARTSTLTESRRRRPPEEDRADASRSEPPRPDPASAPRTP